MNKKFEIATKQLHHCLKGTWNPEKTSLVKCPSGVGPENIFEVWDNAKVEAHGRPYLKVLKEAKGEIKRSGYLGIIRSYRSSYRRKMPYHKIKVEFNTFTLLYDPPGPDKMVNTEGNELAGHAIRTPTLLSDKTSIIANKTMGPTTQSRASCLGKKGIVAWHSSTQYSPLDQLKAGEFIRFHLGPTPEGAILRLAHTLQKLSEGDPKKIPEAEKALISIFEGMRRELIQTTLDYIEAYNHYDDKDFAQLWANNMPQRDIGPCEIEMCADKVHGMRLDATAICLHLGNKDSTAEEQKQLARIGWLALLQ